MALLSTVFNNACDELAIPRLSSYVGSTDAVARQFVALLRRECLNLLGLAEWVEMQKEYTITTVNAQESYALPGDFDRHINRTQWDRQNRWELIGPITPQEWQWRKSGIIASSPRRRWRVKGATSNQLFIDPIPSSNGEILVLEYISKNFFLPASWAPTTVYAAAAKCSFNNNTYITVSGGTSGTTPPTHTSGSVSDGGVTWTYLVYAYQTPTSDNDVLVLSEDQVTLGLVWRYLCAKGLDYSLQKSEYDSSVQSEISKLSGAATLNMAGPNYQMLIGPGNIPDSGF